MAWSFQRLNGTRPRVLGHRGARHAAPENTPKAFELAATEGADGVELDVRRCRTGEVVVLHDPTLSRVTEGRDRRHVETLPWSELSRIDVGQGEHVPLLEHVLDWALGLNLLVNVEVKSDVRSRDKLLSAVAALLDAHPAARHNVLLSSFDPRFVRFFAKNLAKVPVGWLVHEGQRLLRGAPGHRWLGAAAVHPQDALVRPDRIARWKAAGSLVVVWTVNDPERARVLAGLGVDAIISDVPGRVLQALVSPPQPPGAYA